MAAIYRASPICLAWSHFIPQAASEGNSLSLITEVRDDSTLRSSDLSQRAWWWGRESGAKPRSVWPQSIHLPLPRALGNAAHGSHSWRSPNKAAALRLPNTWPDSQKCSPSPQPVNPAVCDQDKLSFLPFPLSTGGPCFKQTIYKNSGLEKSYKLWNERERKHSLNESLWFYGIPLVHSEKKNQFTKFIWHSTFQEHDYCQFIREQNGSLSWLSSWHWHAKESQGLLKNDLLYKNVLATLLTVSL